MTWPRAPLLLVASSSRTGPAEGFISLAAFLRARGLDARVCADTVRAGDALGDIGVHLDAAGVPWERELRLSRKVRLRDLVHDGRTLSRWVREGRHDVLQAAFSHEHRLCLWAARRAGAARENLRVVRTAHRRIDVTPGPLSTRLRALQASDGVIVHAESYRRALLTLGLDERRVAAIPGGVDAQRFSPGPSPLRAAWGVPEDAPLAGIVARMKPERGHRELLQAFARIPDAWLVLVGRGEHEPALRALAASLPAPARGRVVFGGYRRGGELSQAYRALDVAVWLREGNDGASRGVLEAMACGVPVVVGNEGAPPELVRDQVDGRVVDAASPADLAAALRGLLGDLPAARKLGASARGRAVLLSPERASQATLDFWLRLRGLPPV